MSETLTDIVDRLRRAYTRTGGNSVGDPFASAIAAELAGLHARIDEQLVTAQGLVLEAERRAQDVIDRCEELDEIIWAVRKAILDHVSAAALDVLRRGAPGLSEDAKRALAQKIWLRTKHFAERAELDRRYNEEHGVDEHG